MQGDRCTGHCCRAFFINAERLAVVYEIAKERAKAGLPLNEEQKDSIFWAENLIVLPARKSRNHNPYEPVRLVPLEKEVQHPPAYTCAKLRPNGDCGDYENRPLTCSTYPNGHTCTYVHCTDRESRNIPGYLQGHGLNELVSVEDVVFGRTRPFRRACLPVGDGTVTLVERKKNK